MAHRQMIVDAASHRGYQYIAYGHTNVAVKIDASVDGNSC